MIVYKLFNSTIIEAFAFRGIETPSYMKPQESKSEAHIGLQPRNIEKASVQAIMMLELCGHRNGEIAQMVDMTEGRVSIIRNSPLYKQQLAERRSRLQTQIIEKKSTAIADDPVLKHIQENKVIAVEKLTGLMEGAKNEFLQASCAKDILDRAGYMPEKKVTTKTIEVTEQMAERFERALTYRETRTRITTTPQQGGATLAP